MNVRLMEYFNNALTQGTGNMWVCRDSNGEEE